MRNRRNEWMTALLSQEGSVIAKQSHEGWFRVEPTLLTHEWN